MVPLQSSNTMSGETPKAQTKSKETEKAAANMGQEKKSGRAEKPDDKNLKKQ